MFQYKNRKRLSLIDDTFWLPGKQSSAIKKTVYYTFRQEILPYLPVTMFKKHFSVDSGRPTKDLQSMLGLFIIQALMDFTDDETVEAYCFYDTVRYALDLPRDAYLSQRTYYSYRAKLLGEGHIVFEQVLERISERLKLEHGIQRKDSTLVGTHLKQMSRLELFRTTVQLFFKELDKCHPIIFSRLPEKTRERYLPKKDKDTWFTAGKPSQYKQILIEAAKDILFLIDRFAEHASVSGLETFQLLQRLAREQIQVQDDIVEVRLDKEFRGSALNNPHDPEARYDGHKEKVGYHVQVTETCAATTDEDNPKIITQVEVNLANTSDVQTVVPGIERLEQAGLKPDTLLTDNGYDSDDNHQELKKHEVDLVCPPTGQAPDGLGVLDFALDEDGKRIQKCPTNRSCWKNSVNDNQKSTVSYFDVETCRACPHSSECPIKITKRKAKLTWRWNQPRLEARRLQFADNSDMKKLFRQRSGGEAPMSILKIKMGLARIRRRGRTKVTLSVFLAATALNVQRTHRWVRCKTREAMSKSKMLSNYFLRTLFCRFLSSTAPVRPLQQACQGQRWGLAA
jgi:hypothetical protein